MCPLYRAFVLYAPNQWLRAIDNDDRKVNLASLVKLCYVILVFMMVDWLVDCFGFNGPLRQFFSQYRAITQREGEKREMTDERQKCPNNPHPLLLQAQ